MNKLNNLRMSFVYALRGVAFCIRHERNMRIHLVAVVAVMYLSQFYELSRAEVILLVMTCMLVMAFEMINTAVEVVIDKVSPAYSPLAKVGKDVAAGAVFLSAVMAVIVGLVLFWDIDTFGVIARYFFTDIYNFGMLLGFGTISFLFISSAKKRNIKGKRKDD